MIAWMSDLRRRLAPLDLAPAREAELAQELGDGSGDHRVGHGVSRRRRGGPLLAARPPSTRVDPVIALRAD